MILIFFIEILFDQTRINSSRSNISGSRETESCKARSHKTNEQKRKLAGERNGRCGKSKTSCHVPKRFKKNQMTQFTLRPSIQYSSPREKHNISCFNFRLSCPMTAQYYSVSFSQFCVFFRAFLKDK